MKPRRYVLTVRLSPSERRTLQARLRFFGCSASDYVRAMVVGEALRTDGPRPSAVVKPRTRRKRGAGGGTR